MVKSTMNFMGKRVIGATCESANDKGLHLRVEEEKLYNARAVCLLRSIRSISFKSALGKGDLRKEGCQLIIFTSFSFVSKGPSRIIRSISHYQHDL
jgi:hypothetical protein